MSRLLRLLAMGAAPLLVGCSKAQKTKEQSIDHVVGIPELNRQRTPSSERSRHAILRVGPRLIEALARKELKFGAPVFIRIFKQEGQLELWLRQEECYRLFRTYEIAGMSGDLGPKLEEGDLQAPEGFYHVSPARMNPNSDFHLSFNLGYPNAYDRAHGRTGSALMVHGGRVSIGCFAMTDAKIEEIYTLCDAALRGGQKFFRVHCFPFRMTQANMTKHKDSRWFEFWQNLKIGHDWFEQKAVPPNVTVEQKRYLFGMP